MTLADWLEAYPEFAGKGITEESYKGANVLAELYLCHVAFDTASDAYSYLKGLLVSHLMMIRLQGGNPVEKAQSLESYVSFKVPDATKAFLTLSDSFYGRTVNDIVNLAYLGGFSQSFQCVGNRCC